MPINILPRQGTCETMNVNALSAICAIDYEYARIIRRLRMYGLTPTGSKSADKQRLHEIEIRLAKQENCTSTKFITVTQNEQEKIQDKKKEKREEVNPELNSNSTNGQEILGQQIMLALNMKKKK